ncbi:MAG TPA: HEAT repeat domain-containing protein [Thermoanaerobaculia bacterium]
MSTTTSPQVADFVRALALAWKNLAAYPTGHPALAGALQEAERRLEVVRGAAGDVTFGIVADGLLYAGEKIDTEHARKFAYALYTSRVALLTFDFAVDAAQIERFLRTLGVGTQRNSRVALWDELAAAGVTAIRLQPVDYSGVQMTDSLDVTEPALRTRGTLWEDIVRALMSGQQFGGASREMPKSVDELSAMIVKTLDESRLDAEFDANATFGVKLMARVPETGGAEAIERRLADTIRLYVAGSSGSAKRIAVQQTLQILRGLPEQLRAMLFRSMLDALARDDGAASLLAEVSEKISRDYVLDALQHLDQSHFASHALLLLRSLSGVTPEVKSTAPAPDLNLLRIFADDDIDRFNPPDHQALLESVTVHIPTLPVKLLTVERLGDRVETVAGAELDRILCETLFSLAENHGDRRPPAVLFARIEGVLRGQLLTGRFKDALVTIERLRAMEEAARFHPIIRENARLTLIRLADPEVTASILASIARVPERSTEMRRVMEALGGPAIRALLVALTEEENRSRRRRLYDFAISLGPAIVPEARTFLTDERWFVVRNMIVLLRTVQDRSALRDVRRCAEHPDLRVRLQAIKTLLTFDNALPRTLLDRAINDPDPKLAETAIMLAANYGIKEAVDPLLRIVSERDLLGTRKQTRMHAIRALGELAESRALVALQQFFTDSILPWPPRDERRVAFESLSGYEAGARLPIVEKGLKSRDPVVREICQKLKGAEAPPTGGGS